MLAFGTVLSSVIALVVAVPVALGVAIFIVEYAPKPIAKWLGYLTDMLATVPSVIYGLWGLYFLVPRLQGFQHWLATWFGWIPIFADPNRPDVGRQQVDLRGLAGARHHDPAGHRGDLPRGAAPGRPGLREAALALGRDPLGVIRTAVLPPSRPGIISAIMLGLGRALGETIAIALILGTSFTISIKILQPGGQHDRREHRQLLRRGRHHRAFGADREWPGAVRDDPAREHASPAPSSTVRHFGKGRRPGD